MTMSSSLRSRVNKLAYEGHISQADADRIRDALEKQMPKEVDFTVDCSWGVKTKQPVCSVCGHYLTKIVFIGDSNKVTYCEHCGQKVLWGDEDE